MKGRFIFIIGFLACVAAMGTALYFQYGLELEPCPLCILQRIVVISLGLVFLIAALHNPNRWGRLFYGSILILLNMIGMALSIRHLWLQYGNHETLACGASLDYMLETMPWQEVLGKVLKGTGDCGEIVWSLFGISIPGWTLLFFILLLILNLKILKFKK